MSDLDIEHALETLSRLIAARSQRDVGVRPVVYIARRLLGLPQHSHVPRDPRFRDSPRGEDARPMPSSQLAAPSGIMRSPFKGVRPCADNPFDSGLPGLANGTVRVIKAAGLHPP